MIALLARERIPLVRTDRHGSVLVLSDGANWRTVNGDVAARGPSAGKARSKSKHDDTPKPAGGRINVNTATEAELEALPGIGSVIARRIVEGRPYRSVEVLDRVKAIGKERLGEIRPLVTVD